MNIFMRLGSALRTGRVVAWTAALTLLAGVGVAHTVPYAQANITDPTTGQETGFVGLALAWTPSQIGRYAPRAANFNLYDDHGHWAGTSTCESFNAGSAMRFPINSPQNRMPTGMNMSFTLTLYAVDGCQRTTALWDYSGVPTAQEHRELQWITQSDWESFAGGQNTDVIPGKPPHRWLVGQDCPAICPS